MRAMRTPVGFSIALAPAIAHFHDRVAIGKPSSATCPPPSAVCARQRHAPCVIGDTPKQNSTENLSSLPGAALSWVRLVHCGRLRETFRRWSKVRRPRAGLVTPPPGGLGSPSVPTKRDCLQWLDAARTKGGESCPDQGGGSFPSAPGSYGPGDRKAAMERRSARTLSQRVPAPQGAD